MAATFPGAGLLGEAVFREVFLGDALPVEAFAGVRVLALVFALAPALALALAPILGFDLGLGFDRAFDWVFDRADFGPDAPLPLPEPDLARLACMPVLPLPLDDS